MRQSDGLGEKLEPGSGKDVIRAQSKEEQLKAVLK